MFPDLPRSTGKIGQKAKTAPMGPHAILAGPVSAYSMSYAVRRRPIKAVITIS